MLNKIQIIGRLGHDPESVLLPDDTLTVKLRIATNRNVKDEVETTWHRVVVWGKLAATCANYLKKGHLAYVEGRMNYREYDKDGETRVSPEIIAETIKFLTPRNGK